MVAVDAGIPVVEDEIVVAVEAGSPAVEVKAV